MHWGIGAWFVLVGEKIAERSEGAEIVRIVEDSMNISYIALVNFLVVI